MSIQQSSSLIRCLSRPGPSRLATRTQPCPSCIRFASTSTDAGQQQLDSTDDALLDAAADSLARNTLHEGQALTQERSQFGSSSRQERVRPEAPGYENWFKSVAPLYREPPKNGPNWLGKDIPYPTNPSFRPPPPLSDALKDLVYSEVYSGGTSSSDILSTVQSLRSDAPSSPADSVAALKNRISRVSQEFGISKKRVEAILKLKEHERGLKERGESMQKPFLEAMEQYLGVRPIRPKSQPATTRSWAWESKERSFRKEHPSTLLESTEEASHEAFSKGSKVGLDTSAFTQLDTLERDQGVERAVWEFRDEGVSPERSRPGGEEPLDVPYNRIHSSTESSTTQRRTKSSVLRTVPSVGQDKIQSSLVERATFEKSKGRAGHFRFVNSSKGETESGMSARGMGKRQDNHGRRERKAKRQERVQKAVADKAAWDAQKL